MQSGISMLITDLAPADAMENISRMRHTMSSYLHFAAATASIHRGRLAGVYTCAHFAGSLLEAVVQV